ncbi:MAG: Calx-beta domain-containing protein [Candidatus Peregrinibacteria bacterium]|nr:Calx-beta domain-containing protein [Candidatus Peregrinibacteria bacterium]
MKTPLRAVQRFISVPLIVGMMLGSFATAVGAAVKGSVIFSDVQPGSFYDDAVGEMYELGVIKGYEDGKFGPNDYVTRGQLAVMFSRFRGEAGAEVSSSRRARSSSSADEGELEEDSSSSTAESNASVGAQGAIRFTTTTFLMSEAGRTATVSVIRTGGKTGAVSVEYTTSDGTATAGTDYEATSGKIEYADGETTKSITIPIKEDTNGEGNETFNISLSSPGGGAVLGTPKDAKLTIVDNDATAGGGSSTTSSIGATTPGAGVFSFNATGYGAMENAGTATITVQRTGGTTGAVTINYATSNGTATSADYSTTNGTLNFAAGESTKTFSVTVVDDATIDGNKSVNLTLTSPGGGAGLGVPSTALLTIVDNETTSTGTGSFKFSAETFIVVESSGTATITVQRVGGHQGTVSVAYVTSNGTATSGSDFTATNGTLTFLAGEVAKTFTIPILKDTIAEEEETVTLNLNSPTNGADIMSPSSATLKIQS